MKSILAWLEKQGKQKPSEWSEEDFNNLKDAISLLAHPAAVCTESNDELRFKIIDWLKSLRPQSQWRPSKEHLHTLEAVISDYTEQGLSYTKDSLNELYEQLKKL